MPFPYKGKVKVQCEECGTIVEVYPYRVKLFRFCSAKCKYNYLKRLMIRRRSPQSLPILTLICQNVFCKKTFQTKRVEAKYCCRKCHSYTRSEEYKLRLENEKAIQESLKKNIWKL